MATSTKKKATGGTQTKRKQMPNTKLNRTLGIVGESYTPSTNSSNGRKRKRSESSSIISSKTRKERKEETAKGVMGGNWRNMQGVEPRTHAGELFDNAHWRLRMNEPVAFNPNGYRTLSDHESALLENAAHDRVQQRMGLTAAIGQFEGSDMHRPKQFLKALSAQGKKYGGKNKNRPVVIPGEMNDRPLQYVVASLIEQEGENGDQWLPLFRKLTKGKASFALKTPRRGFTRAYSNYDDDGRYVLNADYADTRHDAVARGGTRQNARRNIPDVDAYIAARLGDVLQTDRRVPRRSYREARQVWDMTGVPVYQYPTLSVRKFATMWEKERALEQQYVATLPTIADVKGVVSTFLAYGKEKKYSPPVAVSWFDK